MLYNSIHLSNPTSQESQEQITEIDTEGAEAPSTSWADLQQELEARSTRKSVDKEPLNERQELFGTDTFTFDPRKARSTYDRQTNE